jgi:hypothetical protein
MPFARADYLINFAVLKGHSSGITVCGKNHYGSLLRTPVGGLRGVSYPDYYNLHLSLPNAEWSPGMGHYRATVDLMGHRELGGKTLLYLVDGLFGGYYWDAHPYPWKSAPFGDGTTGDWPSSLFASQDPVAIDSVAYDFLLAEWPDVVSGGVNAPGSLRGGAEDYLHEAALANDPPSGAFTTRKGWSCGSRVWGCMSTGTMRKRSFTAAIEGRIGLRCGGVRLRIGFAEERERASMGVLPAFFSRRDRLGDWAARG